MSEPPLSADPPSGPRDVTNELVFDRIVKSTKRVLVSFVASWCDVCRSMEPILEELVTDTGTTVITVDIEETPQIANRFDVESVPTFLVFERGTVSRRLVGVQDGTNLREAFE